MSLERNFLAEHVRRAAKFTLPERITDHRARRAASGTIVARCEKSARNLLHAQDVEEFSAHPQRLRVTRFAAQRKIKCRWPPGKNARKSLLVFAHRFPNRIRHLRIPRHITARAFLIRNENVGEFLRM